MVIKPIKRYAPVRVTNPLSDLHMVYLHANQGFTVEASAWMAIEDMDFTSDYFKLANESIESDGSRCWDFEITQDLSVWSQCSNTYLGEVQLITKDTISTLCVVLLSENPAVFTLINPKNCEIKVAPHQIIEFVFYGPQADDFVRNRSMTSGGLGLIYTEKGNETIAVNSDLVHDLLPSVSLIIRPRNDQFTEHHYWYGLDQNALQRVHSFTNAVYYAGKIGFGQKNEITILVNLNVKKREPKKEKTTSLVIPQCHKSSKIISGSSWREPSICDVSIALKGSSSLHDGCKVIDLPELKKFIQTTNSKIVYPPAYRSHCSID